MKYFLSLMMSLAVLTSGCTMTDALANRIACTVAKDEAFMVSEYGPVGISSKIDQRDSAVICK